VGREAVNGQRKIVGIGDRKRHRDRGCYVGGALVVSIPLRLIG
jgi:hypothetical protein